MKSVPEDKENDAQESASPGRSSVQSQTQKWKKVVKQYEIPINIM